MRGGSTIENSVLKVAETLVDEFIVTVQVLGIPVQPPPLQPKKPQAVAGLAFRVT